MRLSPGRLLAQEGEAVSAIDDARAVFQRWLYLPDTGALDIVLATVATNRMEATPSGCCSSARPAEARRRC